MRAGSFSTELGAVSLAGLLGGFGRRRRRRRGEPARRGLMGGRGNRAADEEGVRVCECVFVRV